MNVTAAVHVTVGLFLWALDGSLLLLKELPGDSETHWVESVWTPRLHDSHRRALLCHTPLPSPTHPERRKTNKLFRYLLMQLTEFLLRIYL